MFFGIPKIKRKREIPQHSLTRGMLRDLSAYRADARIERRKEDKKEDNQK